MTKVGKTKIPVRNANYHDRRCDVCKKPMIGIMVYSDYGTSKAPRTICYTCEQKRKK